MSDVAEILNLYESNRVQIEAATTASGGSFDALLNEPFAAVLKILAMNHILIEAAYVTEKVA